jgi:hypothetical protein
MSKAGKQRGAPALGDLAAFKLQELRAQGKIRGDLPLLRIDQRADAAKAPFRFDSATGRLHRRDCRAIPRSSRSALYGVWQIGPGEQSLACEQCRPVPIAGRAGDDALPTDLFYGFLSVLDQFGHVLRERGREYRKGQPGRRLLADLGGVYSGFEKREREILDVITSALDGFLRAIQDVHQSLNGINGHGTSGPATNGQGASGHAANGHAGNGHAGGRTRP